MSRVLIFIALVGLVATVRHRPHSRTAFGDVTVAEGEEVRSVLAIGGSVTLLEGAHARDVTALGGSIELGSGSQVERDAMAVGGDIFVGPGARIGRNASTYGGAIEVDQGGAVAGTISPHPGYDVGDTDEDEEKAKTPALGIAWALLWGLFELFTLFAFGALLLLLLPGQLDGIIASFSREPWASALTGLLGSLLLPPIIVMLVISLVGILFIPILLVAVGLAGAMGYAALALFIGRRLPLHVGDYGKLALGVLVVTLLSFVPIVGALAWFAGWLVVFGAVLRSRFGTRPTVPRAGGNPPPVVMAPA
jgi:hypothetical protein